jgi:hypothetical protein
MLVIAERSQSQADLGIEHPGKLQMLSEQLRSPLQQMNHQDTPRVNDSPRVHYFLFKRSPNVDMRFVKSPSEHGSGA